MDLYEVYELENKYNYIINNKLSKDVKTQKVAEYIGLIYHYTKNIDGKVILII